MSSSNTSDHYLGAKGKKYFAYQNQGNLQQGKVSARKFIPYIKPSDTVLDFGCGNGSLLLHLNCHRRLGIEVNPVARAAAIEHIGQEVYANLTSIDDESIDVIISHHALEHVLRPLDTLIDLRRKLKPNGRLILCTPIDDWRTQMHFKLNDHNHHLYTWTPLLMGNLLQEANYHLEQIWVYSHAWPPQHWQQLDNSLPVWLFDIVCYITAWRLKSRQVMAIAIRSDTPQGEPNKPPGHHRNRVRFWKNRLVYLLRNPVDGISKMWRKAAQFLERKS